jgi:threonylcarbamoyladenosine tRNA methylthiotransferase MtaB
VYVINTCSVTDNADKECRQLVRRIQRRSPESLVVITGCYAQLKPKEISEIPGVDLVLGAAEKFHLAGHLRELTKGDSARISSCDIADVPAFMLPIRSTTGRALSESAGWLRLWLFFLHHPDGPWQKPERQIANVLKHARELAERGEGDRADGCEPGRFWQRTRRLQTSEENFYDLIVDWRSGRYRAVPHFLDRAQPAVTGDHRIRGGQQEVHAAFSYSAAKRQQRDPGAMRRRYKKARAVCRSGWK